MSKIELTILQVEEGTTCAVTIPADCDREHFAEIIRYYLTDGKSVITEINIDRG